MTEFAIAPGWGERLETFWIALGLRTQADFAQWVGLSEDSQVGRWKKKPPRTSRIRGWAERTTRPDEVYGWLVRGGERPDFAVYGGYTVAEPRQAGPDRARELARRLRALADEVEGLASWPESGGEDPAARAARLAMEAGTTPAGLARPRQGAGGALAGALLGPFGALCAWVLWTKERAGKD